METPPITDHFLPSPKWFVNRVDPVTGIQGRPRFIVIHIQQGSSPNSWNEHAFVRNASATVYANRDGSIWRVAPEQHGPWTNGDVCLSTAAGWRVRNLGANPNIWCLTIETEGFTFAGNNFGWPPGPTVPQFRSVLWQVRRWMQEYGIPLENVIRHADLNNCTDEQYRQLVNPNRDFGGRFFCPGDAYYGQLVAELREEVLVSPAPPPPPAFDGADVTINGRLFHAVAVGQRQVKAAIEGLEARQFATTSAQRVRAPLGLGEEFTAHYWVEGQDVDGENRWWVADDGARIWSGGTDSTPGGL